ncbi:unnamed protein product [Urochloa humidicola]
MAETSSEYVEPDNVFPIRTAQELDEKKNDNQNKKLLVYGFTSKDYEQPSRIMSRTFKKLSMDTRFKDAAAFFEMDVDNFQDLARHYKLDVYPAFLLLNPKDTDKEVGARVTGINPGKLESSIEEALNLTRTPPVRHPPAASLDHLGRRRPRLGIRAADRAAQGFVDPDQIDFQQPVYYPWRRRPVCEMRRPRRPYYYNYF